MTESKSGIGDGKEKFCAIWRWSSKFVFKLWPYNWIFKSEPIYLQMLKKMTIFHPLGLQ